MCDQISCVTEVSAEDKQKLAPSDKARRAFMKGALSLPLASVLAFPELAKAAAQLGTEKLVLDTPSGGKASGVIAMPEAKDGAEDATYPTLLLFPEWWGLNDQIKAVAADLANQGFMVLATDPYNGETANNPHEARALMSQFSFELAWEGFLTQINYLRTHEKSNGKIGIMGWCFGGGLAINAALRTHSDATIIYYGRLPQDGKSLSRLSGPVMGHFGRHDRSINKDMVEGFLDAAAIGGVADQIEVFWYDANHAFANPTGQRFHQEAAKKSWGRSLDFLNQHLKS